MTIPEIILLIIAIIFLIVFLFLFTFYFKNEPDTSLLKDGKLEIEKTSCFYIE